MLDVSAGAVGWRVAALRLHAPSTTMAAMGEIIHRSKLFGGRMTAAELHAKYAWGGAKCSACGGPPAMRVQVFLVLADIEAGQRFVLLREIALGRIRAVRMGPGPAVKYSDAYACSRCSPALERQAARAPSYALIDIDRGPGPDNPVVGVIAAL